MRRFGVLATVAVMAVAAAGCGDDGADGDDEGGATVVVTTPILGDVVERLVGDAAEVVTIMPPGAEPHDFQASARQAAQMRDADALVVNGGGFEEGLEEVVEGAADDGTPTYEAWSGVEQLGDDPHFFTDPARMAVAAEGIADFLAEQVPALAAPEATARASAEVAALRELDAETEAVLAPVRQRVLVTDHEVFAYFADRYDFDVVGTVIPGSSTTEGASAGDLARLAETIADRGVPAIFVGVGSDTSLADALAQEVGGEVEVVELYSETLGPAGSPGDTYAGMVRSNAGEIAGALGGADGGTRTPMPEGAGT